MILVIGGTHECREIVTALVAFGEKVLLSVATDLGATTYGDLPCDLVKGRLDEVGFETLMKSNDVHYVIDASHPHAVLASETLLKVTQTLKIPYVRYRRKAVDRETLQQCMQPYRSTESRLELYEHMDQILDKLLEKNLGTDRILITGTKNIEPILKRIPVENLVVRVVPSVEAMEICEKFGLKSHQIIGLKGPFTEALTSSLLKAYDIKWFIFKESGAGSGYLENLKAALATDVTPLMLSEPKSSESHSIDTIEALRRLLSNEKIME